MQKRNKILMGTISALLCLVLISSCCLSGIYAKFVKSTSAEATILLKKWGIEVDTGTNVASSYTADNGKVVVSSTVTMGANEGLMAPGMGGYLAYFRIQSDPNSNEFEYDLDFSGQIDIGDGYFATSGLILDNGTPIEYFPITLFCKVYNVTENTDGSLTLTQNTSLKNTSNTAINTKHCLQWETADGKNHRFFNSYGWSTLARVEGMLNETIVEDNYKHVSLNKIFDNNANSKTTKLDRLYVVEWYWPYDADDTRISSSNRQANYDASIYDTQICDYMYNNRSSDAFDISLEMSVTIIQTKK